MYEYQDKFRITISYLVSQVIENDCFSFSFVRKNGEANISGYLLRILPFLYESRRSQKERLRKAFDESLGINLGLSEMTERQVDSFIEASLKERYPELISREATTTVFLRKSKTAGYCLDQIIEEINEDRTISLSSYLSSLFCEYAAMARYKREQICFSDVIRQTQAAMIGRKRLCAILAADRLKAMGIPLGFVVDIIEEENVLLCYDDVQSVVSAVPLRKIRCVIPKKPYDEKDLGKCDMEKVNEWIDSGGYRNFGILRLEA